jgi:hypothetical protein
MRVFFLFLFIINLLIAFWFYSQPAINNSPPRPMPDDLDRLILLGEGNTRHVAAAAPLTAAKEKPVKVREVNAPTVQCYTLGPFKDEIKLQQASAQLAGQVLNINVRKREESQRHRYWVYLPVMPSRASAIDKSKKLAQARISDYYIVRSGAKKNAISMGHYKEKQHADRRVSRLKKQGFAIEMEVIFRQINIFWLDYSIDGSKRLSGGGGEYLPDGVTRLYRSCNNTPLQ